MAAKSTPATQTLGKANVKPVMHEYEPNPNAQSYGMEAARALGMDPERVFKTLVVQLNTQKLCVAVIPAPARLNLKLAAAALGGKKATMADPALAEKTTGYVVGGISPFGQRRRLPTVIDTCVSEFDTVVVSGGRRGLMLEVAVCDLIHITQASTAVICS